MIRRPAVETQMGSDKGFILNVVEQLHLPALF